jgi:hypothetical protein
MPPGIRECLDSITKAMPDYDVVVHGAADMDELVPESGSLVERTNLYRTRLLYRHGGWWVDADCYALRPFNSDKPFSFGAQEMTGAVVDWAFGSEAGNPDLTGFLRRLGPSRLHRRSSIGLTTLMSSLGEHMAKELGGRKLEPSHVYGSRRFSHRAPSRLLPKNATLIHLFLGSWYLNGWRKGVLDKVKEVMRW